MREIGEPGKVMLDDLLRLLAQKKVLPPSVEIPFRTVQAYGNFGAHPIDVGPIRPGYVTPCFAALEDAADWYFVEYLQIRRKTPRPFPAARSQERDVPSAVVLTGAAAGERMALPQDTPFRIGREPDSDLRLPEGDLKVSRDHAVIEPDAGRFVLRDLGSKNGTWLNGTRVDGSVELRHGDELRLGRTVVLIDLGVRESLRRGGGSDVPEETELDDG